MSNHQVVTVPEQPLEGATSSTTEANDSRFRCNPFGWVAVVLEAAMDPEEDITIRREGRLTVRVQN